MALMVQTLTSQKMVVWAEHKKLRTFEGCKFQDYGKTS